MSPEEWLTCFEAFWPMLAPFSRLTVGEGGGRVREA